MEFFVRAGQQSEMTEALREYARRKLLFAVRRFRHRVRYVTVRLVDENGPRRGVDSRCSITADLVDGGQLFVEATAAWPFAALTLAAGRLSEVVRRDSGRHNARRTAHPSAAI
jgi:ribosome-associated translation inhibitor RaiA